MLGRSSIKIRSRLRPFKGCPDFTPFAGVFFLLLIFFMIGSSFVQVSGIPVDLPQTHAAGSFGARKFVVTIDRQSRIFFNDMAIPGMDILKEKLMEVAEANPAKGGSATIIVRADSHAPFGVVAKLMSLAEELKVNAFVLTVPPPATDGQSVFVDTEK
jgi:biopolymer transport protein ExbD